MLRPFESTVPPGARIQVKPVIPAGKEVLEPEVGQQAVSTSTLFDVIEPAEFDITRHRYRTATLCSRECTEVASVKAMQIVIGLAANDIIEQCSRLDQ